MSGVSDAAVQGTSTRVSVSLSIVVLVVSAGVLIVAGVRFTRLVDELADRTGMGEAIAGAVLLGATTSLPGLVTSITGAAGGDAGFAVSNAVYRLFRIVKGGRSGSTSL